MASGAISWIRCFPKAVCDPGSGLPPLFDCLFPPEEQSAELDVGFRGRRANRIPAVDEGPDLSLASESQRRRGRTECSVISRRQAVGWRHSIIHLFGSVFRRGLEPQECPLTGKMLKTMAAELGVDRVRGQCLHLLLPYFDFEGQGQEGTGVPCRSPQLSAHTDGRPAVPCAVRTSCFDSCYLDRRDIQSPLLASASAALPKATLPIWWSAGGAGISSSVSKPASQALALRLCASRATANQISWNGHFRSEIVVRASSLRRPRFARGLA